MFIWLFLFAVVADPLPMATKVYCLRHHQRMRAVLGALFRDASNLAVVTSGGTSPDRLSGGVGEQVPPVLTLSSDQSSDLQTNGLPSGYNQKKVTTQTNLGVSCYVISLQAVWAGDGTIENCCDSTCMKVLYLIH